MTLQEARIYFEKLKSDNSKKREKKVFEQYIHIISELEKRSFSADDIQLINKELAKIISEVPHEKNRRYFKKELESFKSFLKDTFSLTIKGYYTSKGVEYGMIFGMLCGLIFLSSRDSSFGIAIGLSLGMCAGVLIGRSLDQKATKAATVI